MERDVVYEYMFKDKMMPFIEVAREWWQSYESLMFDSIGSMPLLNDKDVSGIFVRFYRTPAQSTIKGIQAFPYIPTQYIDMLRVPGGIRKYIHDICVNGYMIDEFILIERMYLHGTERSGQFICIIPQRMLIAEGKYVWLTRNDILELSVGNVTTAMRNRFKRLAAGHFNSLSDNFNKI